ncbi:MAG: hypothetical protein A2X86_04790 [Bdellovibrionales bacterium GWA2_49_15]|nr:MAG: hypothetical protein A2X86_04790 [Bdellovibrionales bacterium GWA2_49_15]
MVFRLVAFLSVLVYFFSNPLTAQVVDEIDATSTVAPSNLPTEKIESISPSKRIFLVTNTNSSFERGDYISMILNSKIVARALVAKMQNDTAGIKILRIHSLSLWNTLRVGSEVQILRGDDSYFNRPVKKELKEDLGPTSKIEDEDDLYSETKIGDDDLSLEENKNRAIKNDNLVTGSYGRVEGVNNDGGSQYYGQFMAQWAYQIEDNIWVEGGYGQGVINDFPSVGLDTVLRNITFRAKYTVAAPLYSFIQPYIGYQMVTATSDSAGVSDGQATQEQLDQENELMDKMNKNRPVFGVSWLKRLVPGWFMKVDLGTDIMNLGFTLEF